MNKNNKEIDKDGLNEVIHLSKNLLKIFYIIGGFFMKFAKKLRRHLARKKERYPTRNKHEKNINNFSLINYLRGSIYHKI